MLPTIKIFPRIPGNMCNVTTFIFPILIYRLLKILLRDEVQKGAFIIFYNILLRLLKNWEEMELKPLQ